MKQFTLLGARLIFCLAAFPLSLFAQLNVPSDGSDGPLNIATDTVIDLSQAVTGSWSENNSAHSGNGIYDPSKWAVVFKYSSIQVAAGAKVTFQNHASRAPVVWLVSGDVNIAGTVSLDAGGPGGFRGGFGKLGWAEGGAGLGPGGAGYRGGQSGSGAGFSLPGTGIAPGSTYGNQNLLPLLGGSGGSGEGTGGFGGGYGGGDGGGAILIAAARTVTVGGVIRSVGGADGCGICGHASGGAIRIIADTVSITGSLNVNGASGGSVGSPGRIRIEANGASVGGASVTVSPSYALPGVTPQLWLDSAAPTISIASVDGQNLPADPQAGYVFPKQDVSISNTNLVTMLLQGRNVAPNWNVTVRIVPKMGTELTVGATFVSGDSVASTWQAQAVIPDSFSVLQARASAP